MFNIKIKIINSSLIVMIIYYTCVLNNTLHTAETAWSREAWQLGHSYSLTIWHSISSSLLRYLPELKFVYHQKHYPLYQSTYGYLQTNHVYKV